MITEQQQRILEMPFSVDEHDFVNGNVFLKKSAIRRRLSMVDPGWESTPRQLVTASDDLVVYQGGLTVCGVTRYAIGTGIIIRTKTVGQDKKKVPLEDFELARSIAKAHKAADSDIMARAAIPFGIGAYLKSMPKGISNTDSLAKWLAVLNKPASATAAVPPTLSPQPASNPPTAIPSATAPSGSPAKSNWWELPDFAAVVYRTIGMFPGAVQQKYGIGFQGSATFDEYIATCKAAIEKEKGKGDAPYTPFVPGGGSASPKPTPKMPQGSANS
jgi:hypothetical protein